MRHLIALALALLAPLPALALSCMAPSVERSYAWHDEAKEAYLVVHGHLTFDAALLPKGMTTPNNPPERTLIPGVLTGTSLGKSGFAAPFSQDLTLEIACLGPWCGSAQNGADVLAFVRKDANGYTLSIGPCGGSMFSPSTPAMLKEAKRCMQTGQCKAQ